MFFNKKEGRFQGIREGHVQEAKDTLASLPPVQQNNKEGRFQEIKEGHVQEAKDTLASLSPAQDAIAQEIRDTSASLPPVQYGNKVELLFEIKRIMAKLTHPQIINEALNAEMRGNVTLYLQELLIAARYAEVGKTLRAIYETNLTKDAIRNCIEDLEPKYQPQWLELLDVAKDLVEMRRAIFCAESSRIIPILKLCRQIECPKIDIFVRVAVTEAHLVDCDYYERVELPLLIEEIKNRKSETDDSSNKGYYYGR